MNFAALKSNVQSAMGRSDVPAYVYTLTTSGINRDFRLLEMQSETALTTSSESVSLPTDFLELESVYIDSGGSRTPLIPINETSQATRHDPTGRPYYYAVHDGELTLMAVPDGEYTLVVRYYARLADFVSDSDTNDVITNYPDLYLYGSLTHAAIWAADDERAASFNAAFTAAKSEVMKRDLSRRMGGPMVQRSIRQT